MHFVANDGRRHPFGRAWLSLICSAALLMAPALTPCAHAELVRLETLERRALQRRALPSEHAKASGARAAVSLARSAYHPTLALNGDAAVAPGSALIRVADVNGDEYRVPGSRPLGDSQALAPEPRYGLTLSLAGNIYDFGRTADRVAAAQASALAVQAEVEANADRVLRDVHRAYLEWLVAEGRLQLASQSLDEARARRQAVQGRVEEGSLPEAALFASRTDEAKSELELVQARGSLTAARLTLEAVSEVQLSSTAEPDAGLLDISPGRERARPSASATALSRRRDAALANARSYARPSAPVVAAALEAGVRGQNGLILPIYRVGVTISVPLSDGGAASAREEMAKAEAAELLAAADDVGRELSNQEASAHAQWANAGERVTAAEQLRLAAEQVLRAAEERHDVGAGSVEAVIDARTQLLRARSEVLLARATRADAVLRLRELGRISGSGR